MHKLVIWIRVTESDAFTASWPRFLGLVERLPGLRREATTRVESLLYGEPPAALVHELYFETRAELQSALASPDGQEAGRLLQAMTGGRVTLFIAQHQEEDGATLRQYRQQTIQKPGKANGV